MWNELGFGSDFLDADSYYSPAVELGVGDTDQEILERTIAFIRNPARGLQGVGIGNGFSNQRPWEAGSTEPRGLDGDRQAPLPGMLRMPGDVNMGQPPARRAGNLSGIALGSDHWRDDPAPVYNAFFPEHYLSAIQTEHLVRDISPITTSVYGTPHGRQTHPAGSPAPEVWITETGMNFSEHGIADSAAARLRAKATMRASTAFVNKGVRGLYFYAARGRGPRHDRPGLLRRGRSAGRRLSRARVGRARRWRPWRG